MSESPFDPSLWRPVDKFDDLTDITYHRHVADGKRSRPCGSRSTGPRCATRSGRTPSTSCTASLDHARMTPDVGVVLLTGNGPSPKDGGWAFCSGGDQRIRGRTGYQYAAGRDRRHRRRGARRAAAHPRGAAADPVHAEGRHLPGQRLGRRRWAQPARGVRPDAGQPRARPVQADRRRRRQLRRRLRQRVPGQVRSARSSPARSSSSAGTYTAEQMHHDGRGQRGRRPRRPGERRRSEWAPKINGKSPQAQRMLKYAFNLTRRRPGRPAAVRRRGHPAGVHDRRGRRGPRRVPGEARPGLEPVPALLLTASRHISTANSACRGTFASAGAWSKLGLEAERGRGNVVELAVDRHTHTDPAAALNCSRSS